ncbi:HdeD family acid-resistance protein [Gordonia sp. (in: high G+C Gram-positive bacteria)]|uniref:HdeD family acid-resistance protein n=1 Tax=Gordonia sp. (in: high G+C Gram-positive bacteria) TaxID=84139 RepID=UPI0039E54F8F
MTIADIERQIPEKAVGAVRGTILFTALLGIVIGVAALVWPGKTLNVLAILLGISLIATGLFRLYQAFSATLLSGGLRFAYGLIGLMILWAGIVVLWHPSNDGWAEADRIWFLAVFIGVGWIFQGLAELFAATTNSGHSSRVLLVLSGLVAIAAGVIMLVWPAPSLLTFVWIAGILLIIVSVASLFTLPKKV